MERIGLGPYRVGRCPLLPHLPGLHTAAVDDGLSLSAYPGGFIKGDKGTEHIAHALKADGSAVVTIFKPEHAFNTGFVVPSGFALAKPLNTSAIHVVQLFMNGCALLAPDTAAAGCIAPRQLIMGHLAGVAAVALTQPDH